MQYNVNLISYLRHLPLIAVTIIVCSLLSCDNNSNRATILVPTEEPVSTVNEISRETEITPTITPTIPISASPTPEIEALFLYNRGLNLLRSEQFIESANSFSTLIKRMPDLAIAYKSRGAAYYHLERYELAKTDLEKALTLDVDLGGTHLYLGLIHKKNGNVAEAKKELQMAINLIHPIRETEELLIAESALANLGR
jgi:tetratricopeptide (TPR) repeat protein